MSKNVQFLFARPALVGLLILAFLPFIGLVCFVHPAIDDFDNAETVARLGRWGAQWYWYTHWSGRFVAIGLSTLLNPLAYEPGEAIPSALLPLRSVLLLLMLGVALATQQFFASLLVVLPPASGPGVSSRISAWVLSLAIIALGFNALPEPFTLLYWYSGSINYLFPFLLLLIFLTAALRAWHLPPSTKGIKRWGWVVTAALGLGGAIGSGEITLLVCLVVLAGLGLRLHSAAQVSEAYQKRLWAAWLGIGIVAACFMLGAPGNWQRLALADPDPGPWYHRWLLLAPRTVLAAVRLAARPPVLGALLVLFASVLLTTAGPRAPRPKRQELLVIIGSYLLINTLGVAFMKASFMHDVWVEAMPDRAVNVLVLQLLVSTTALALWVRQWLPTTGALAWGNAPVRVLLPAATLLLVGTGQARWAWQELLFVAPAYDHQMHQRYAILERSRHNRTEAVLAPLRLPAATSLLAPIPSARKKADVSIELHADCKQKNNQFLAHYYRIPCVRLSSQGPSL